MAVLRRNILSSIFDVSFPENSLPLHSERLVLNFTEIVPLISDILLKRKPGRPYYL